MRKGSLSLILALLYGMDPTGSRKPGRLPWGGGVLRAGGPFLSAVSHGLGENCIQYRYGIQMASKGTAPGRGENKSKIASHTLYRRRLEETTSPMFTFLQDVLVEKVSIISLLQVQG